MTDIVKRLREPPFGTETSERNLMSAAADEIAKLREALLSLARENERRSCPASGTTSLSDLGIDHYYDPENWEATYGSADPEYIRDIIDEADPREPRLIETLIKGPQLYAANIPIAWGEEGDPEEFELRFYPTEQDAREALAAKPEGRVAPSATGDLK